MAVDIFMKMVHFQKSHAKMSVAKIIFPIIPDALGGGKVVTGDALDIPFAGWIRCNSVSHCIETKPESGIEIPIPGTGYQSRYAPATPKQKILDYIAHSKSNRGYADVEDPKHGIVTVKKNVDRATPQLSYACASKQKFSVVCLAMRKRVGPGMMGIKLPFFLMTLRKCRLTKYDVEICETQHETICLDYGAIHWLLVDSFSNTGVPSGIIERGWDLTTNGSAGEGSGLMASLMKP